MIFVILSGMLIYEFATGTAFSLIGDENALGGYTVLSMSEVSYVSNQPELNRDAFLMTVVQNNQGESAEGTFKSVTADDKTATETINIRSTIGDYRCVYPITATDNKIYHYRIIDKCLRINPICSFGFEDRCEKRGEDYLYYNAPVNQICVQRTVDATIGLVKDARFDFQTDFDIIIGDVNTRLSLTPNDISDKTVDNRVYVSWVGNLVTGENCPSSAVNNIAAVRGGVTWDTWVLVDSDKTDYVKLLQLNDIDTCMINAHGSDEENECISIANKASNDALVSKDFKLYGDDKTYTDLDAVDYHVSADGVAVIDLSQLIQYPIYRLIVDVDTLNIRIPVGMPEILDVTSDLEFTTGSFGTLTVLLKNIGEADGAFAVTADCESPFSYVGIAQHINLVPGGAGNVMLQIVGESTTHTCKSCVVKVYDRNFPDNKDEKTVSVCVNPILICEPNDLRCVEEKDEKCVDGTHWEEVVGSTRCVTSDDIIGCMIDDDCDDGDVFTYDKCRRTIIQTTFDKPGTCEHTNMLPYVIFASIFMIIIFMIIVALIIKGLSKR